MPSSQVATARPGLVGDLEAHGLRSLALDDSYSRRDGDAKPDVPHPEGDQVTCPQFRVDGQVEKRQLSRLLPELQPYPYGPDIAELQPSLPAHELALVPRDGLAQAFFMSDSRMGGPNMPSIAQGQSSVCCIDRLKPQP